MNDRAPSHEDLMLYVDGELDSERASEVEAYLADSQEARDVVATIFEMGNQVRVSADEQAQQAGADDIADWVMAKVDEEKADNVVQLPSAGQAAPAGSIWPVALGGLAVAAGIALIAWRFAGLDLTPATPVAEVSSTTPVANPEMVVASAHAPAPDYDPEPSVSVDAIDFGARTGTIFYVPSDTGTTTVVWLTDDEAGEN